jgi:uridine kinase
MATTTHNHHNTGVITLGIAGGTGAGKTTLARAIYNKLGGSTNCVYLTHDHYYRDLSHKPLQERSKTNFDHPDSLETDLLVQHLQELKQGRVALLPTYDFATHSRTPVTTLVHPKSIIIVEGILIFTHPALCHELDIKVFVDADSDTRVVRRIRRDTVDRGRTLDSIMLQYETFVKPMHAEWVAPSKAKADVIINSENGHSTTIALDMLSNHLLLAGGIVATEPLEQVEEMDQQQLGEDTKR